MDMKRIVWVGGLVTILALAGCNGNGGGTAMIPVDDGDTGPTVVDLSALLEGYTDIEAGEFALVAGQTLNRDHATFTCQAGGETCTVTVTKNDDGPPTVTSTGGQVTVTPSQMAIDDRDAALAAIQTDLEAQETALMGVTAPAQTANDPINPNRDATLFVDVDTLVSTESGGKSYTQLDPDPAAALEGFKGATYRKTTDAVVDSNGNTTTPGFTDTVTVYDNEGANEDQAFKDYYADGGLGLTAQASVLGDSGVYVEATRTLTFSSEISTVTADDASWFQATGFFPDRPTTPGGSNKISYSDANNGEARTFGGSFNGIGGDYTCTGTTCSVTANEDGTMAFEGTWTFVHGSDTDTLTGVIPDPDYLQFGYWLQYVEKYGTNDASYGIKAFAGGNQAFANGAVSKLMGSATYSGKATGRFALASYTPAGVKSYDKAGQFTATTSIKAQFGTNPSADGDFMLSGSVTDFRHEDAPIDGSWTVTFEETSLGRDNSNNPLNSLTGGVAKGGVGQTNGEWSATLFGDSTAGEDGVTPHPTGVAGTFNANFSNGSVVGAYGATKTDPMD